VPAFRAKEAGIPGEILYNRDKCRNYIESRRCLPSPFEWFCLLPYPLVEARSTNHPISNIYWLGGAVGLFAQRAGIPAYFVFICTLTYNQSKTIFNNFLTLKDVIAINPFYFY